MNTIKPIGEVIYPNKDGFFTSSIDQNLPLQKEWLQPTLLCVQEVQKHLPNLISSIYIRGSVARGIAIDGVSDIDLVVITKNSLPSYYSRDWVRPFVKKLRSIYPQVDDIEFEIIPLYSILKIEKHMGMRVLLSLQGKLLVGDDLLEKLPPIKPDASSFVHIPTFSIFQKKLKQTPVNTNIFLPVYIPWVAKRYIRTGFELCIEREKVFTRDLYLCYEIFSKYYPSKKHEMYKALKQVIKPTWKRDELFQYVNIFGDWLEKEVKNKYPEYI